MISLLGRTLVLLALGAAGVGSVAGFAAGMQKNARAWALSRWMAYAFAASMGGAVLLMEWALLSHDFSVSYVAQVGSRSTPTWVTIVSLWSSLEGSILFWGGVLGAYVAAFTWMTGDEHPEEGPWSLGVLLAVSVFFAFLIAGIANPFGVVDPPPPDGPGPNALLQNHILMVVHPPALYLGYVGMAVPFAVASAALLAGRLDKTWVGVLRRTTLVPWGALTVGIILGGWWSYEVLGWGGYWAWDPVENASLLPWLTATAFVHSSVMTERKDQLKAWTIALVLGTFLLTILGTFMTRSGVFNSVHAFTQSDIGPTFLGFLALCMVWSVVLLATRMDRLSLPEEGLHGPASREVFFLVQNLAFCALTFTVLLGTVYPLLKESLTGTQLSVGEPYFNKMGVPLGVLIVFLMGVGPALPWGRATGRVLAVRVGLPALFGAGVALVCALSGFGGAWALATYWAVGFAFAVTMREMLEPGVMRARKVGEALPVALWQASLRVRRRTGGYIVHLGVLCIAVGVAASSTYRVQQDFTFRPGVTHEFEGYALTFAGTEDVTEPHRTAVVAKLDVTRGGQALGQLLPRLNNYRSMAQPIGTPDVRSGLTEDLYLSLVQIDPKAGTAAVRVIIEPMVWWIWFGGGVMVLGTLIAAWPRSRRATPGAAS